MPTRDPAFAARAGDAPDVRVGDYRLLHRLGEGGMGVVHLAQAPDGTRLALKVLRPHVVGDDEARDRLAREVRTLERVRSPHVAEIIDADPFGPVPFVATRYVPGLSLHDHVPQEGPMRGRDLAWFARTLAEALTAVHAVGVLHRDVKPSNVVMEGRSPILIDFGLARLADDDRLTRTGWLLGTPGYLAPEVLHGDEPTAAADVFAWAATVAFAGTGRPPFGRGPSMAVMDRVRRGEHQLDGLGPEVAAVVHACLDPEPSRRPSLTQVLDRLTGPVPAAPPTVPVQSRPEPTRVMAPERAPYQSPPVIGDEAGDDEQPPETEPPAARTPFVERARRWGLGVALLGLLVCALAAAPYVVGAGTVLLVAVLRWFSLVGSGSTERRDRRGRRWYDVPLTALLTPVALLASVPGTLLLLACAALLLASALLVLLVLGVGERPTLLGLGLLWALMLWTGPGASRVRSPLRRLGRPISRALPWWIVSVAVLGGVALGLLWATEVNGVLWDPASGAPWRAGTWLGDIG